jgi:hypothetical protein
MARSIYPHSQREERGHGMKECDRRLEPQGSPVAPRLESGAHAVVM